MSIEMCVCVCDGWWGILEEIFDKVITSLRCYNRVPRACNSSIQQKGKSLASSSIQGAIIRLWNSKDWEGHGLKLRQRTVMGQLGARNRGERPTGLEWSQEKSYRIDTFNLCGANPWKNRGEETVEKAASGEEGGWVLGGCKSRWVSPVTKADDGVAMGHTPPGTKSHQKV